MPPAEYTTFPVAQGSKMKDVREMRKTSFHYDNINAVEMLTPEHI